MSQIRKSIRDAVFFSGYSYEGLSREVELHRNSIVKIGTTDTDIVLSDKLVDMLDFLGYEIVLRRKDG